MWPFCYWVALVVDHFSRKCVGFAVFLKPPSSIQVRAFLVRVIQRTGVAPRHLISDKGPQFWQVGFKAWCKRKKVKPEWH